MNAATLAAALGGRKAGAGRAARPMTIASPAFRSATPTTARCWCAAMRAATRPGDRGAALARLCGWRTARAGSSLQRRAPLPRAPARSQDDAKRTEVALAIWQSAMPADGTLVETYLASRGLHLPPPPTLRFHAGLKHPSGGIWPAMVALVTRGSDDTPLAIHRTFLARDGGGKAPVDPQKMMLGPCRGGAVRLAEPGDVLMVGEGIETCLAAMQATGHPAWAALSTSGLRDPRSAGRRARRDRSRRWRRSRRGGGARLPRCAGSARAAACASPARRRAWISTTCCWAARPASRRARNERANIATNPRT